MGRSRMSTMRIRLPRLHGSSALEATGSPACPARRLREVRAHQVVADSGDGPRRGGWGRGGWGGTRTGGRGGGRGGRAGMGGGGGGGGRGEGGGGPGGGG